jgi:hypothetical protein
MFKVGDYVRADRELLGADRRQYEGVGTRVMRGRNPNL